jgi:hypothetical protein
MPVIIRSIPTTNKTIPIRNTIVTNVKAGKAITYIDIITAITPKPICAARTQNGDFVSEAVILYNQNRMYAYLYIDVDW